jgi:hypothetical protein
MKKMESEVKYGDKTMTNSIYHGKLKDDVHSAVALSIGMINKTHEIVSVEG